MILTFVTLTNDVNKVPVWECANGKTGLNVSCFIRTSAFPKRIMLLGPNGTPAYSASEISEVQPGIFISKMELPYTDLYVAGDDLRPFIEGYDPNAPHKNVVVILIDRTVYNYLDSGVGPSHTGKDHKDSVIVNTFHAKEWAGCIAAIGDDFERGKYNPPRMVGMYINYAVNGAPRSKMLREMCIKGNQDGISITDELVDGEETSKKLLAICRGQKKRSFRIQTNQRLSNLVIVPEGSTDAKEVFAESPADYLENPYGIRFIHVPVDAEGNVVETDYVKKEVLPLFERTRTNKTRSVIFYQCRPSKSFFEANLSYIFVAGLFKKRKTVSYLSIICP